MDIENRKRKRQSQGGGSRNRNKTISLIPADAAPMYTAPVRAYTGSLVPYATRGYRQNNIELKVADLATATYNVHDQGTITLLACPTVGADFTNRVGRKITLKTVYVKGAVAQMNAWVLANQTVQAQHLRMIIFVDYQPNAAAPAVTDILNNATPASQLNLNNRDRFRVIADKEYVVDPFCLEEAGPTETFASTCNQIKFVKKFKRINIETIFNNNSTGAIGDITSGALFMLWIGTGDHTNVGQYSQAKVSTRVRFSDQ